MAASSRPSDKFAFLLTGLTSTRYLADLKMIFEALTQYYGYPAANIWVVQGSSLFQNTGDFTNAHQYAIGSETDPIQKLKDIFHNDAAGFSKTISAHISTAPPPAGSHCTAVLYFTGGQDPANLTLNKNLIIRPDAGSNEVSVDPSGFTNMLQFPHNQPAPANPLLRNCQLSVVMQQDFSFLFHDSVIIDTDRINFKGFSNACGNSEKSTAGITGSKFTEVWSEGLKFQRLDNLGTGHANYNMFADELDTVNIKYNISFGEAVIFAGLRSGASNYGYNQALSGTESSLYPGKPSLVITDGDDMATPRAADQSPDIWIENSAVPPADNCYFEPGVNNDIKIRINFMGTHPVRVYSLGIKVTRNNPAPADEHLSSQVTTLKKPGDSVIYSYTYLFNPDTYQDIKAIAAYDPVTALSSWNIPVNDNEAQRLIFEILGATASIVNPVMCNGGTGDIVINATGGAQPLSFTFGTLQNTTGDFNGISADPLGYSWSVTDALNCTPVTGTLFVSEPPLLVASILSKTDVKCNGAATGDATADASGGTVATPGGYSYSWNTLPAQTTKAISGLKAGTYTVTVTDDNGCTSPATVTITEPPKLVVSIISRTDVVCFGEATGEAKASATGGTGLITYLWDTVPPQNSDTATGLKAGTCHVTATDSNGCYETVSVIISNLYIDIKKVPEKSISIIFKKYPRFPWWRTPFNSGYRYYEVRVEGRYNYPSGIIHSHPEIELKNIVIVSTQYINTITGVITQFLIKVPFEETGLAIIHPFPKLPPLIIIPLIIPVVIYNRMYRRYPFGRWWEFWRFWPWWISRLRTAKFKLYITNLETDYRL